MNDQLAAILKTHRTVSVNGVIVGRKKPATPKRYSRAKSPAIRVIGARRVVCDESWTQ